MTTELGASSDPEALVPGDPSGVAADARVLRKRADDLVRIGESLRRIDTGAWTGPASRAWHERHDTDVPRWFRGADSLDAAGQALAAHAEVLSWAQREAGRAVALWHAGEMSSALARAEYDRARATAPPQAAPPEFADPGSGQRQSAVDVLERARARVRQSGSQVGEVLRGEAGLAPRDSQKQADEDFYGGIGESLSGVVRGVGDILANPADAMIGVVSAAAHPVQAAKDAIAWDDWTSGRESRALGRNTGDAVIAIGTLGIGRAISAAGREAEAAGGGAPAAERPDGRTPRVDPPGADPARAPQARAASVGEAVLDEGGRPHGIEDSKGVFMVDEQRLDAIHQDLRRRLGEPDSTDTSPRGRRETWVIGDDPKATVTYRTFSSSGGATIDVNRVDGVPAKRFHVDPGER